MATACVSGSACGWRSRSTRPGEASPSPRLTHDRQQAATAARRRPATRSPAGGCPHSSGVPVHRHHLRDPGRAAAVARRDRSEHRQQPAENRHGARRMGRQGPTSGVSLCGTGRRSPRRPGEKCRGLHRQAAELRDQRHTQPRHCQRPQSGGDQRSAVQGADDRRRPDMGGPADLGEDQAVGRSIARCCGARSRSVSL
jgi:hypothetical protein